MKDNNQTNIQSDYFDFLEVLESTTQALENLSLTIFIFENAFHQMHLDQFSISAMNSLQHIVNDIKYFVDNKIQQLLDNDNI